MRSSPAQDSEFVIAANGEAWRRLQQPGLLTVAEVYRYKKTAERVLAERSDRDFCLYGKAD